MYTIPPQLQPVPETDEERQQQVTALGAYRRQMTTAIVDPIILQKRTLELGERLLASG